MGEKLRRRLRDIARGGQVEPRRRTREDAAEVERRLAFADRLRVEAKPCARRVVRSQLPGRGRRARLDGCPAGIASPKAAAMASREIAPGRSRRMVPPRQAMIVDSSPSGEGPSSRIQSTRPCRSAATCSARVGLTRPDRFADGATSGSPTASISARAILWEGARRATVSSPARASRLIRQDAETWATIVSGPGQNAAASRAARGSRSASRAADAASAKCAINGLNDGRPLAAKIAAAAESEVAKAASP